MHQMDLSILLFVFFHLLQQRSIYRLVLLDEYMDNERFTR